MTGMSWWKEGLMSEEKQADSMLSKISAWIKSLMTK
jgi:hypothetical protein